MKRLIAIAILLVCTAPVAAIERNVSGQKLTLQALDSATGRPKTGDAANITAYVSIDGDTTPDALTDTSATELSSTNLPGVYLFDLSQAETNGINIVYGGKSTTSGIDIVARAVTTTPPNFGLASIDANGRVDVIKVAGTTQTARDLGASVLLSNGTGTGQVSLSSGVVSANAVQLSGDSVAADNAEAFFDGTGYGPLLIRTGITTVNSQTDLTLSTTALAQSMVGARIVIRKSSTGQLISGIVNTITAGEQVTFTRDGNADFTITTAEVVEILLPSYGPADRTIDAAIKAKTDNLPASPASTTNITAGTITTVTNLTNAPTAGDLTSTMKSSINAEVLDVLNTDTHAEPGQAAPAATASWGAKIDYLYKAFRNKKTQTATTFSLFDDAGTTVDQKATTSDDGTTTTVGEVGTGP